MDGVVNGLSRDDMEWSGVDGKRSRTNGWRGAVGTEKCGANAVKQMASRSGTVTAIE